MQKHESLIETTQASEIRESTIMYAYVHVSMEAEESIKFPPGKLIENHRMYAGLNNQHTQSNYARGGYIQMHTWLIANSRLATRY